MCLQCKGDVLQFSSHRQAQKILFKLIYCLKKGHYDVGEHFAAFGKSLYDSSHVSTACVPVHYSVRV